MRFTGERFIPGAWDVEPTFQRKMWQEHLARYLFGEAFVRGKNVLDAGCGVGYGTDILGSGGARTVIGVDIAEEAVRYARERYARPGVTFATADVTCLPFKDRTFDVVVAFECIEHLRDPGALIREAKRVLRDHGTFVVSTPRRREALRSRFHTREFDLEEFETLLKHAFGHVAVFGERNCVATIIGSDPRVAGFSRVDFTKDLPVEESDYFVAVCGQRHTIPEAVAVVNDDEYILNLESRVETLQGVGQRLGQHRGSPPPYPVRVWMMYRKLGARGLLKRAVLFLLVRLRLTKYSPPGAPTVIDHLWAVMRGQGAAGLWCLVRSHYREARVVRRALRGPGRRSPAGPVPVPSWRVLTHSMDCSRTGVRGASPRSTRGGRLRAGDGSSPGVCLRVGWFIPPPFAGSGGHKNIFRAVRYMATAGHEVALYIDGYTKGTGGEVERVVEEELGEAGLRMIKDTRNIEPSDVFFATQWPTVETVLRYRDKARCLLYLVQDIEPYLYPASYEHIRAERTYKAGLEIITSGPWCARVLRERYGVDAEWFAFPVDRGIYFPRPGVTRERTLVAYFARPEMPRRLFPLGIEALRILKDRRRDLEVVLFGSDAVPGGLPFAHTDLGVVRDLNSLARLYSAATVGVAFSVTNPSLVPYELMACECPVVDVDYGDSYVNYGSRENVMLAAPAPEEVAAAIERLLDDEALRVRVARNAREFVRSFPDEEEVGEIIERFMLRHWTAACDNSTTGVRTAASVRRVVSHGGA